MPNTKPSRLLIVDDEAFQLKALCNTLQDEGFVTVGFSSPLEALATELARGRRQRRLAQSDDDGSKES